MAFAPFEPQEVAAARTIQAQAARNLAALRGAQPLGPYFLIGLCHGGLVAYEMACQLEQSGERVELLALLDAYPSGWKSGLSLQARAVESLRHGALRTLTHTRAILGGGGWTHLRGRLALFCAAWKERASATACRVGLSKDGQDARLANREAQRTYVPSLYGGAVTPFPFHHAARRHLSAGRRRLASTHRRRL